jgi:hypothetical protein
MADQSKLDAQLQNLQKRGASMPQHPARAALEANTMHRMARSTDDREEMRGIVGKYSVGPTVREGSNEVQKIQQHNEAMRASMGESRSLGRRLASGGSAVGGDVMAAIPRFYDPLEYWDLSGLPWNMADEGHRHKLHKWLRLYQSTHYLIPILVDIFTRFPLVGMNLECKDPALVDFYEDLFFDQLDYEDFLMRLGREFWIVGEAYPLSSFDEHLGVWEREQLLFPEDIVVENIPLLDAKQLKVKPPDHLKRLVDTKNPPKEYRQLELSLPEVIPYVRKGEAFPVSDVLLKQVANRANDWDDHGTPILLRGLRTLLHEEKLMASQDAIAERLYSPLILAKLGIMDLGDGQGPWIPGPDEIDSVRDDFDIALSSDFRLLVHHFGLDVTSVFGREQMPRLGDDFDRIERRLMQVFGVNPSLLSAGASTQPYASSALQAEFLNQILRTFQKALKDHFRDRAMVVAEAQGHYDYETKGTKRIPIMEEVVVVDPDTGEIQYNEFDEPVTEEREKLLVPDLDFATLDLRDEATERQFLQTLRQMGVPISDDRLMVGVNFDPKDEVDKMNEELKNKTISQQQAKFDTYTALVAKGLPIPPDLKAEVESVLGVPQDPNAAPPAGGGGRPPGGMGGPAGPGGMGPGGPGAGAGIVMPNAPPGIGGAPGGAPDGAPPGAAPPGGGPPARAGTPPGGPGNVPPVSNERRPGLTYNVTSVQPRDVVKLAGEDTGARGSVITGGSFGDEIDVLWPGKKVITHDLSELEVTLSKTSVDDLADQFIEANKTDDESKTASVTNDEADDTLALRPNEELVGEGEDERIVHRRTAQQNLDRADTAREKKRKFSFIDPDAPPLEDDPEPDAPGAE